MPESLYLLLLYPRGLSPRWTKAALAVLTGAFVGVVAMFAGNIVASSKVRFFFFGLLHVGLKCANDPELRVFGQ